MNDYEIEQKMTYLANPTTCPACGSKDITGHEFETGAGVGYQVMTCDKCGERWEDIYRITDVVRRG